MEDLELQEEKTAIWKKKYVRLRSTLILVGVVCVLLFIVIALVSTLIKQQKQIKDLIENPMVVSPVSPEIVLDTIHSEICEISELATEEYLFTNAAKFTDSKQLFGKWDILGTKKSFILKWDGIIKAGVDLEKVAFDVKKETIVVTVPKAEILSYETGTVEVMDEKNNVFNPITVEDKVDFDAKTEEAMKQRAIENGLLEKAQTGAEDIIKRLITADSELDEYTIIFTVAD